MSGNIEYYLYKSPEELKNPELKKEIIYNENHYIFIWFCQRASAEQLKALLDDEGVQFLSSADRLNDKLNGILSSGTEVNIFENESFCKMVLDNNMIGYAGSLNERAAVTFAEYVSEHNREKLTELFSAYYTKNQMAVLENIAFNSDEKITILKRSRKEVAEFLLNNDNIDLSKLTINDIEVLLQKEVTFPARGITPQFVNKISSIGDVNRYRFLINELEENNDVSEIEEAREKVYEKELQSINEDGLLAKFQMLKDKIKNGEITINDTELIENLEGFAGANDLIYKALFSKNLDETIKKMNDYYMSNIIIDYFFKDVPTNVLKNVGSMLAFNDETQFLNGEDKTIYECIKNIDGFDSRHKLMLFEIMKKENKEMAQKFYDDFTKARETMVEQINNSILSEDNMEEIYNEQLSEQVGVPVYHLKGQDFKCLVRNIGVGKNTVLEEENLGFFSDGSSFSVDGSEKLDVFGNIREEYTLAYTKIPEKQLIHSFFGDSFSKYERDKNDIPKNSDSAERTIGFYTPEQLTEVGSGYNELLISVPNFRKSNDFEEKLEKPKAFAIYCYDKIEDADIESAKKLGLSIILVDTKSYNIDRSEKLSTHDATSDGRNKYTYLKRKEDKDEREEI